MKNTDRITLKGVIMHFKTITRHRHLVMKNCFKMGLYFQGLTHDLSKYSPSEFWNGARYYQGTRSPNTRERELFGYSRTWLHHKGRNKHHFEYWIDFYKMGDGENHGIVPCRMPDKYVAEMIADRVAACINYRGSEYDSWDSWNYYQKEKVVSKYLVHKDTLNKLEFFLKMIGEQGEAATFKYIREIFLKGKDKGRWERELEESLN
ncbi:DUF5662 family protein [Butyrivibrio sp. VCD2006]|uniref:DUF5662 family protein n=1 Tax=Butyrivibrio sp. VCD2006 TaxID=1280664 RepID=UPI001FA78265|nr:DUF5662 family protein [Butyrivibrio sp. VCD2006]